MQQYQDILPEVTHQFNPIGADVHWRALGSGNIHDTFLVSSEEGPLLVLQRLNTAVFPVPERIIDTHLKVYHHLAAQQDFPLRLPAPVPTQAGEWLYVDATGATWRGLAYLDHTYAVEQSTSPAQTRQAAEAVGIFLRGLEGLSTETLQPALPGFHDGLARFGHFEAAVANDAVDRLRLVAKEVDFVREEAAVFHLVKKLGFPERVVHTDPKIGNLLFDSHTHEVVAVLDWDTIMPGAIPADFGDMVRAMACTVGEDEADFSLVDLDETLFQALAEGFLPPLKKLITPLEVDNLVTGARWIILEQMMRFLTDFINGDVYYKTAYAEHNLVRACNQMALYQAVKEKEVKLQIAISQVNRGM